MRRARGIAAVALLLLAAFALGWTATKGSGSRTGVRHPEAAERDQRPKVIDEVRRELATAYYRPVGARVLTEETIREILAGLRDPHTDYLTPKEYDALKRAIARSYSGVGLKVGPAKNGLRVTSAANGPARRAGVRPGDVIVSVNGHSTADLPFERSLALMTSDDLRVVHLTVRRPRVGTMRFTVARRNILLPALRSRLVAPSGTRIGYVRLFSFREGTAERLEREVAALVKRGAKGLVLDVRDNPGGLFTEAIDVASLFLEDGVVCTTAGEHQEPRDYEVVGRATYPELPIVVVVNRRSASAAEILASGLGENGRALVAGERTFGKASVQSVRELSNGGALKLTTATYWTPSGVDLGNGGVRPKLKARDEPRTPADEALVAAQNALVARL